MIELIPVHRRRGHFHLPDSNTDSNLKKFKSVHVDEERQAIIQHLSLAR